MPKTPKSAKRQDKRIPIADGREQSFIKETPLWSFRMIDVQFSKWNSDAHAEIFGFLKSLEGMTWQEISMSSGGKSDGHGSNSHFVSISDLDNEAQKRLRELHLDTEDVLFSLRIGSKKRLYGLLRSRIFEMIWYDDEHSIYLMKK